MKSYEFYLKQPEILNKMVNIIKDFSPVINDEDTRSFSGSYATVLNNSCGKFEEIAGRSRLEGSRGLETGKNKNR